MKYFLYFLIMLQIPLFADEAEFDKAVYEKDSYKLLYRIFKPADYDPKEKYAMIVTMHGSSCKGSDNRAQLRFGKE